MIVRCIADKFPPETLAKESIGIGHVEHSVHIDRPIDQVFAYVSGVATLKNFNADLVDSHADGAVRRGRKFTQVRALLPQKTEVSVGQGLTPQF